MAVPLLTMLDVKVGTPPNCVVRVVTVIPVLVLESVAATRLVFALVVQLKVVALLLVANTNIAASTAKASAAHFKAIARKPSKLLEKDRLQSTQVSWQKM